MAYDIVAIFERFGTQRFGLINDGTLASDSRLYPQPGGTHTWQRGMSSRMAFPTGRTAEQEAPIIAAGFKSDTLLSGGTFQTYGKPLNGWIFCDANGYRWLIQPDVSASIVPDISTAVSIPYVIKRFGLFTPSTNPGLPGSTGTLTLDDAGFGDLTVKFNGTSTRAWATPATAHALSLVRWRTRPPIC
jgi:hypothetical protein